jgi:hypothetical protein
MVDDDVESIFPSRLFVVVASTDEGPKKATREGVNGSQSKFLTELGLCPEINPKPIF